MKPEDKGGLPAHSGGEGAHLVIRGEDIPFGAYQAIYHSLTKKVEKRTKTYNEAYSILFSDIDNLHQRLVQATKQYNVKSSRCQVTHQFRDDTSREHSSFERFRISDCSVRSCTTRINYEFDFLVVLPAEIPEASEIAQRYTINVLIDQDFPDDNNIDAPYFVRQMLVGRNISAAIEFSDYAVSQALQATVDGWVDTLPVRKTSKFYNFIKSKESFVRQLSDTTIRSITLCAGAIFVYSADTIGDGLAIVLFTMAIAFFLFSLTNELIGGLYKNLFYLKPLTNILVTAGDNERERGISIRKRKAKGALAFIFSGILLTICLGVFNSFLYDLIKDAFSS